MCDNPSKRLLRWSELKDRIPISHSRIYVMMKKDTFPRTVSIGPRSVAWLESEIDEWVELQKSKRVDSEI